MTNNSQSAIEQPEASPERRIIGEYRGELEQLRALVLFKQSQRKIPPDGLDEMEQGLSRIIEGLDRLVRNAACIDDILLSLEKALASVRKARINLHTISDILAYLQEKLSSQDFLNSSRARYENYEEFADLLLEAIEQLDI